MRSGPLGTLHVHLGTTFLVLAFISGGRTPLTEVTKSRAKYAVRGSRPPSETSRMRSLRWFHFVFTHVYCYCRGLNLLLWMDLLCAHLV